MVRVRAAAEQVFSTRATDNFPPTTRIPAERQLEALAKELGYPDTSATEIEARFRAFVEWWRRRPKRRVPGEGLAKVRVAFPATIVQ